MKKKKHLVVIASSLVIIFIGFFALFYRDYSQKQMDKMFALYHGYSFEELVDLKRDENDTILNMIEYRNGLYEIFDKYHFEIKTKEETVLKNKGKLYAQVYLVANKDNNEFILRFYFIDGKLFEPDLSVYGSNSVLDQINLDKDEMEPIFKYLTFNDGFTVIHNAFQTYEIEPYKGSVRIPHEVYNIHIQDNVTDNVYYYDFHIRYFKD